MKKLLILGASIAQIPFIKQAKSMGIIVAVADYNNKAAAIEYSDEYYECSLTDLPGLRKVVADFQPDGITCAASDVGVESCALLCEENGLPGMKPDVAHRVKSKEAMIRAFEAAGVAHPQYLAISSPEEPILMEFPLITKPIDKSGSRGINIAHNKEELQAALEDSFSCSDVNRVIVEEYMQGPEVSVEILIQGGIPYVLQITDKLTTGAPHFIEVGHSQPSQLPQEALESIRRLAEDAVRAVGILDGCGHAEIILTKDGPKMVEIAGRLGGDFITTVLVPLSTGVNMSEYEILRAVGAPKPYKKAEYSGRGSAVRFIEACSGKVASVEIEYNAEIMRGVEDLKLVCKTGRSYGAAANNNDRFGYVIATGRTAAEAISRAEQVKACIKITMDES